MVWSRMFNLSIDLLDFAVLLYLNFSLDIMYIYIFIVAEMLFTKSKQI